MSRNLSTGANERATFVTELTPLVDWASIM